MAALPVTLRDTLRWGFFACGEGLPASLGVHLSSGHQPVGLGRSLTAWASALSLYRLIPGQSSEAAVWAMISWKPIKCSWAYFGSGMERGSHSQNSWAPCWFNYKGPLSPRVSPGSQASLLFLAFCKKQRQLRGGNFVMTFTKLLSHCQRFC